VSIAYIYKALIRRRLTGDSGPNPNRGHRARKLSPDQEAALATQIRSRPGLIPSPVDQNLCAQSRRPMDMMRQGWSVSLFQAEQQ
jgi:transposase